jgi:hypothetical protein
MAIAQAGGSARPNHWLFVYYKVPTDRVGDFSQAAYELFKQVGQAQLICQLMRRPGESGGLITLMEAFGPMEADQLARLQHSIDTYLSAHALLASVSRHSEVFTGLPCV